MSHAAPLSGGEYGTAGASFPPLYGQSLALLTDLYELTMAHGYWKAGRAARKAVFHLSFRSHPFGGGYTLACGLGPVIDYIRAWRFNESDRLYLTSLRDAADGPLFEPAFLDWLEELRFSGDMDAVPEGTVVFPREPLLRLEGPLAECQILESVLLNAVNFQTLIATKAARVCQAAGGGEVLEFGLRRSQGTDGALAASRAAYIGGCSATSNVLAGKLYGIPVRGTHAHSWVMAFDSEQEAFDTYARAMPRNCVFLVDTYDTIEGVRRAIEAGRWLRDNGFRLLGIRLDSGNLLDLSREARRLLDEAAFTDARIVASGDLDEHRIRMLVKDGARIAVWGVGTRLTTGYEETALTGVYKISAIQDENGEWQPRMKLSDDPSKSSDPGILQVRRFRERGQFCHDVLYDVRSAPGKEWIAADPRDPARRVVLGPAEAGEDLLVPVFRNGQCVYDLPPIEATRQRVQEQLTALPKDVRAFENPEPYFVGIEQTLERLMETLAHKAKT